MQDCISKLVKPKEKIITVEDFNNIFRVLIHGQGSSLWLQKSPGRLDSKTGHNH